MTDDERRKKVVQGFLHDFPTLEEARKDLSGLGQDACYEAAKGKRGNWYNPALSIFKKEDGKRGEWYENMLPGLIFEAGWFRTIEEARIFAEEVKAHCKKIGQIKIGYLRRKMTKEEIVDAFKREFHSLEEARRDLSRLGSHALQNAAKSDKGYWFNTARTNFKKDSKRSGGWYENVIPHLALGAGWFRTLEEARKFAEEVRAYCNKIRFMKIADSNRQMTKEEIVDAFKKEFRSLEEARKDLGRLGHGSVRKAAKDKKGHWHNAALSVFKKEGGKHGKWYKNVLPNLALEAGWFGTIEEARIFAEQVKAHCRKIGSMKIGHLRRKMTKEEIVDAFKREFRSLEEARRDLSRLGSHVMQNAAKGKKGNWFYAAHSVFKKAEGKPGVWYDDMLPNLALEAGWFRTIEEARKFAEEVKSHCSKDAAERISETLKGKHYPSKKTSRQYAIVTESFRREAEHGTSFEGIGKLLGFGDVEPKTNGMNGMARAVLNSPPGKRASISPAELLRFKMSTGKWSGEMADAYAKVFPCIAPYLTTRLLMLHALGLAKDGRIPTMNKGASFMSGPGEVYQALADLKPEIEKQSMKVPTLIDVDAEKDMLNRSSNPNKVVAVLPSSPLTGESLDFVECSSLYQFSEKRMPTLVKEVILEAKRVLKEGGALILASTAKRFSPEFEKALSMAGYDIITPANTRLMLSGEAQKRIEESLGQEVLAKAEEAVRSTYFLIAVKSSRTTEETTAEWFRFERPKTELPEEAKGIAAQARRFDHDLKESDASAEINITRMSDILDGLSPETHLRHAELIQSILSKYMLDKRIKRPNSDSETLLENAERIRKDMESVPLAEEKDRYFAALRRMAKIHANKLRISGPEKLGFKANK